MHDDINTALEEFPTPRVLFYQAHKIVPTEIVGAETPPIKTP